MGLLIMGAIMVSLLTGFAHASIEKWVYTYDGSGTTHSEAYAIQDDWFDGSGNIFVAGSCAKETLSTTYRDFTVTSLNGSTGAANWIYKFNDVPRIWDDVATTITLGFSYDYDSIWLYVAGYKNVGANQRDILVIKINARTGTQVWAYRYQNPSYTGKGEAFKILFNEYDFRIYVAGYSESAANNKDFVVLKLDTLGNLKKIYRKNGPGNSDDQANVIFPTGYVYADNIYAAGYITSASNGKDIAVVKLDTALTEKWFYTYDGPGHADDIAKSLSQYTDFYVGGYTTSATNGKDFTVLKVNDLGTHVWALNYDGPGHADDECNAIISPTETQHIGVGYSTDSTGGGKDYTVLDVSNTGTVNRLYRYNGPGNLADEALAIEYSYSTLPLFYTAGYSYDDSNGIDFTVMKHSTSGSINPWWNYQYDGPYAGPNGADIAYAMDPWTDANNIFVPGYSMKGPSSWHSFTTIKLPVNFPPPIPVLFSPAASAYLNNLSVTFRWHKSIDPEGDNPVTYVLKYSRDPAFGTADSITLTDSSYTVALTDTTWYWAVKARDSGLRWSDYSPTWSFSFDLSAPNTPTLQNPTNQALLLDTTVTFEWTGVTFKGPPAPVRYILWVDTLPTCPTPIVDTFDVTTTQLNLKADDSYYWKVKAFDLAGNQSSWTTVWSFGIDLTTPLIDTTTVWSDTTYSGPYLVFTKVTDLFGLDSVFLYYWCTNEQLNWDFTDMEKSAGDWYKAEIPATTSWPDTVKYYIRAKDNSGRESYDPPTAPDIYYQFIIHPVGTNEATAPRAFSFGLKNNPAKGQALFNLALPQEAFITLKLYDVSGRLIDRLISGRKAAGNYQIPWTSQATAGVYFYSFESPWRKEVGKLVLIR